MVKRSRTSQPPQQGRWKGEHVDTPREQVHRQAGMRAGDHVGMQVIRGTHAHTKRQTRTERIITRGSIRARAETVRWRQRDNEGLNWELGERLYTNRQANEGRIITERWTRIRVEGWREAEKIRAEGWIDTERG